MGRPINKNRLTHIVAWYNDGSINNTTIKHQKSYNRFQLEFGNTPASEVIYKLVPKAAADLLVGEMCILASIANIDPNDPGFAGFDKSVAKISERVVTIVDHIASTSDRYGWEIVFNATNTTLALLQSDLI